jgi:hypothetical protein
MLSHREAYNHPNIAISYADILKAIKHTAVAQRTQPVVKHIDDAKFAYLPRRVHTSKTGGGIRGFSTCARASSAPVALTRGFATLAQQQQPAIITPGFRAAGVPGGLPRGGAGRATLLGRTMGTLGPLFRK